MLDFNDIHYFCRGKVCLRFEGNNCMGNKICQDSVTEADKRGFAS